MSGTEVTGAVEKTVTRVNETDATSVNGSVEGKHSVRWPDINDKSSTVGHVNETTDGKYDNKKHEIVERQPYLHACRLPVC